MKNEIWVKTAEAQNTENSQSLKSFRDLNAWKESRRLFFTIFHLTRKFPKEEIFVSVSQMRRAAMSVSSNLAEGFGRTTVADKTHFYTMARGSLTELQNQILLTSDVGLISQQDASGALSQAETTHKLIVGLIKATERRK